MAEQADSSKSSSKNRKRRSKKTKKQEEGFEITTDVPEDSSSVQPEQIVQPPSVDPVTALKGQIEEAKAAKDFKLAQRLREQLWTLRDNTALGNTETDVLGQFSTIVEQDESQTVVPPSESILDDNPAAKSLHKLEKKLRAIEELKEKRGKGIKLEANQRAKIATEDEVRKEIRLLKDMLTKGSV